MNRLSSDCFRRIVMFFGILALSLILIPSLAEAAPWSFAVVGDQRDADGTTGINTQVIQSMANDIAQNRGVSLVLCGGDQIHGIFGGATATLPQMYQNWRAAMGHILLSISYPVRGNHETYGEKSTPYYPYYWDTCIAKVLTQIPQNGPDDEKGMTYSFANQNAFFAGVDQFVRDNDNRINQPWLDQQLAANILPHVFVYGHEPAVAVTYDLSSLAYYPLHRDAFWESLGSGGCRVYLTGHSHVYNRATVTITDVNGETTPPITQLIAGGGGGPLGGWDGNYHPYQKQAGQPKPGPPEAVTTTLDNHLEDQFGYAVVTVDGNQVSITYYAGVNSKVAPTSWEPYETFNYTVTSKNLGLNDVSQQIAPQILTDYYPGIAINKIGTGTLTLNAGTSPYSGPITVSGGKLRVYGTYASAPVTVDTAGTAALHDGTIKDVTANAGGSLTGTGTVVGSLTNNGDVTPGLYSGPWNLGVTGGYAQSATGTLTANIASATDYGRLQITGSPGAANLNGIVSVDLQNDYEPVAYQAFPNIITASGGLTGSFSQIIVTPATPKLNWLPVYTANSFSLRAVPKSPAPQLELLLLSANLHLLPTMARIN
ncbi:MAG: metallophosphoesterase family protein [Desulfobaccales bacterium]